jgi:S-adenosylmethionine-diacylgycerolhomoserine-N-methlytransferase
VLEIGCGTARNLIVAAQRYRDVRFYGIDISGEMLVTARRVVEREGLGVDIRLARADATAFDPALLFGVPGFSRIFVSYSLSMMPGWQDVLARALTWLTPGGELHVVDFGGQERLPAWFRAGLRQWLGLFHVTPRDELEAELSLLGLRSGAITVFERPFRGYAQYAISRRLAG